jgi:hypothetical protein
MYKLVTLSTLSRLAAAILLFVALIHLPIGYYTFMRIILTLIAVYNAYESRNADNKLSLILFIVTAVVFNPIIPIYLRHKSFWVPVDLIFGILFLLLALYRGNGTVKNQTKSY